MKRALFLLLASALLAVAAIAGITSTEAPTVYMILLADNSIEKGKVWPTTEAECVARAKALIPSGSCSIRRTFTNVGTCADVAKPKWPIEKDADGFIKKPGFKEDGLKPGTDEVQFLVEDFVKGPGYPDCWVSGFRIAEAADFGPYEDDVVQANSIEPMATPDGFDEERRTPVQEAKRHEVHLCDEDDLTPCPPLAPVPTACGQQFCGVIG